jgi:hypothetical protein
MTSQPSAPPANETKSERIWRLANDTEAVGRALDRARNRAWRDHKLLGIPIVMWEDGHVVEIQPEDIPDIPEEDCASR